MAASQVDADFSSYISSSAVHRAIALDRRRNFLTHGALCYSSHMRPQPLIAVTDVEASSRWYQRLLGCKSAHGGAE
jgi:hypothetical protein